jgi:hypothetical protein
MLFNCLYTVYYEDEGVKEIEMRRRKFKMIRKNKKGKESTNPQSGQDRGEVR